MTARRWAFHYVPQPTGGGHIDITKTSLYNFDPLLYSIVKLGFTGVYIICFIFAQKHRLWVLVRTTSPRRFYRVPTIHVLSRHMKTIWVLFFLFVFLSENFQFLEVKVSIYLNWRVFVMFWCGSRWCDTFLSAQYLVNQWLDFYQIVMDI